MRWGNAEISVGSVIQPRNDFLEVKIWEQHPLYGERLVPKTLKGKLAYLVCEFKEFTLTSYSTSGASGVQHWTGAGSVAMSISGGGSVSVSLHVPVLTYHQAKWYVKLLSGDGDAYWIGESRAQVESWIKSKFVRLT